MRISSKGRYGLACMICMAQNYESGACITVASLSERLGISKIYLEQVFSLLKKESLVRALKGAQGGYLLTRAPQEITAYEILNCLEHSLFEPTEESVAPRADEVEKAMQSGVFSKMDRAVRDTLCGVTLSALCAEAEKFRKGGYMFYI